MQNKITRLKSTFLTPLSLLKILLGSISNHKKNEKVIENNQHGFRKGTLYLTNLIAFYHGGTTLVDEVRAMDVVYLDFTKAIDSVSHVISGTRSSWMQVTAAVSQGSLLAQYCSTSSLMTWTMGQNVSSASSQMIQHREE